MSKSLNELKIWTKAQEFRSKISVVVKSFPDNEKYKLVDQLVRASRSVTSNIAEGHGRYHYQENIQFCRQARGSLVEIYDHLTVALDQKYIDENDFCDFIEEYEELSKMINGYIAYLQRRKNESRFKLLQIDYLTVQPINNCPYQLFNQ